MIDITNKIKEIATRLLNSGEVNIFMAWEKGEQEFQTRPFFASKPEEVNRLVFDQYAIHNLTNALLKYRDGHEKIGIVVKGCDSRGINRLMQDGQIKRERLYIVGVCCPGMQDPLEAMRVASGFAPKGSSAGLAAKCHNCIQPNPVIYDELIGSEQKPPLQGERFAQVKAMEAMTPDERYNFWEQELSRCIRCYACRQVCVACNCRTCIFDEMKPQWVGRETNVSDNMMFHMVRAAHMAGRCIECGECERVCPANIPLMLFNQKLIKDVDQFFGPYDAGMQYEAGVKPPLSQYRENDPDDFI